MTENSVQGGLLVRRCTIGVLYVVNRSIAPINTNRLNTHIYFIEVDSWVFERLMYNVPIYFIVPIVFNVSAYGKMLGAIVG